MTPTNSPESAVLSDEYIDALFLGHFPDGTVPVECARTAVRAALSTTGSYVEADCETVLSTRHETFMNAAKSLRAALALPSLATGDVDCTPIFQAIIYCEAVLSTSEEVILFTSHEAGGEAQAMEVAAEEIEQGHAWISNVAAGAIIRKHMQQFSTEKKSDKWHSVISGALFDFCGFLTTRKRVIEVGATAEAAPVCELLKNWAAERGLQIDAANVNGWISTPPSPQPATTAITEQKQCPNGLDCPKRLLCVDCSTTLEFTATPTARSSPTSCETAGIASMRRLPKPIEGLPHEH